MERFAFRSQILLMLTMLQTAFAVPFVENVTGIIANCGSITINGTGFGGNGPNLELFDDFENGTDGDNINTGSGSATVGGWSDISGGVRPTYSRLEALSGRQSFRGDFSVNWTSQISSVFSEPVTEFFGCWWWLIPAGTNIPGEGASNGINWKTVWIMGGFQGSDDDLVLPVILGASNTKIAGNSSAYGEWIDLDWGKGQWKRVWFWLKGGADTDGQVHMWELTNSKVEQEVNDNGVQVYSRSRSDSPHEWEQIHINAFGRPTSNCYPSFDDIYLATGPNARARIEIGDAPNYMACTNLTICTPGSWSDTSITATVRQGKFKAGERAFAYVFDANGECNTNGFVIKFGAPNPQSIRMISNNMPENGGGLLNLRSCNVLGQIIQNNRTGILKKVLRLNFGDNPR